MKVFPILLTIAVSITAIAPAPVHAERAPTTMGRDARVRTVWYNQTDVIRVDTNLRINTALELGAGERIEQVLLGDSEAYDVEVLSNRRIVSVKPVVSGASSNMTIYTGRRAIAFVLTEGRAQTPTYRVALQYADTSKAKRTRPITGTRDTGYEFSGDGKSRPLNIWNDGTATYFEFRPDIRPSIFAVDSKGYELSVNSQTRGNIVRVTGIRSFYTIRIAGEEICIRHVSEGVTAEPSTVKILAGKEF